MNHRKVPTDPKPEVSATECQLTIRLLQLLQRTGYELVQENGQRRLSAPEIVRGERQRVKGAEVFLGRLPRDCYEDELMPLLERVGRLMELRLMLDFSGSTRGYAFALFENARVASRACEILNKAEVRPGYRIGVVKSVDNCRLFFGGVPKDKNKEDFLCELRKILDGITDVFLYPSAQNREQNRGFVFVEFKDHRAAAMARRKLIPGRVILWGHEIAVDWADPEPGDPVDEEVMETVTALFVRNLSLDMSQQKVKETFQKATNIRILKLKKINHFAFVHYENRQAAETVMDIMSRENSVCEKEGWEVRWAKPIGAAKIMERQRCINEAVASSTVYKPTQSSKQSIASACDGKPAARQQKAHQDDHARKRTAHLQALQLLVKQLFGGVCSYECVYVQDTSNFVCKITIYKNETVIFQFVGDVMPSKNKAISVAAVKLYQYLTVNLPHGQQNIGLYYAQEKIASNWTNGLPAANRHCFPNERAT